MELSPVLYHYFVRPKWIIKHYNQKIKDYYLKDFEFDNRRILDFGCGIGSNCSLFHPKSYVGIDISTKRIKYARKLYKNYSFLSYKNDNLPFNNHEFDYIFLMAVLHHIPPEMVTQYLVEFHRVLRSNGKIIIIEPCFTLERSFSNWFMQFCDKGKYILNEGQYMQLFEGNQYQINQVKKFNKGRLYHEIFFTAEPINESL